MKLASLLNEIKVEILHRPTFDDARTLAQVNLIHAELQRGVKLPGASAQHYWRCQKSTSDITDYPASAVAVTVAADCLRVRYVNRVGDGGAETPIEGASQEQIEREFREAGTTRGMIMRWLPVGANSVGLYPPPLDALQIKAGYYALLPDYAMTGDEPVETDWFLENIPMVLAYGTAAKIAAGMRDDFAAYCRGEFLTLLAAAVAADAEGKQGQNASVWRPLLRGASFGR